MHIFPLAILTAMAMFVWAIAMAIWAFCEGISSFAVNHPFEFTRAFLGAIAGLSISLLLGVPYEFTLTAGCSICAVIAGKIL